MNEQKTAKTLPACPVETTLSLIGDKWKVLILRDLMPGTKRFGELKKSIGSVSQKVLTAQLRDMESNGLVTRTVYPEVPPRVEYSPALMMAGKGGDRGPAARGIFAHGAGEKPEADPRRDVELGRELQGLGGINKTKGTGVRCSLSLFLCGFHGAVLCSSGSVGALI